MVAGRRCEKLDYEELFYRMGRHPLALPEYNGKAAKLTGDEECLITVVVFVRNASDVGMGGFIWDDMQAQTRDLSRYQ